MQITVIYVDIKNVQTKNINLAESFLFKFHDSYKLKNWKLFDESYLKN